MTVAVLGCEADGEEDEPVKDVARRCTPGPEPGLAAAPITSTAEAVWTARLTGPVESAEQTSKHVATVATVESAGDDRYEIAVRAAATGRIKWARELTTPFRPSIADLTDDVVVVRSLTTTQLLSTDDGTRLWRGAASYLGATDDSIVTAGDSGVLAHDLRTGREAWRVAWAEDASPGPDVVVVSGAGRIAGVEAVTGRVRWQAETGPTVALRGGDDVVVVVPYTVDDGQLETETATAFDRDTGERLWDVPISDVQDVTPLGGDCVLVLRIPQGDGSTSRPSTGAPVRGAEVRSRDGVVGAIEVGDAVRAAAFTMDGRALVAVGNQVYDAALRPVRTLPAGSSHVDVATGFYDEVEQPEGHGVLVVTYTPLESGSTTEVLSLAYREQRDFLPLPGAVPRALVVVDEDVSLFQEAK